MRILGFSQRWPKLQQDEFTTFRFTRRDADWQVGEVVQVVYKPRSKGREVLGIAKITDKQLRWVLEATDSQVKYYSDYFGVKALTDQEAILDGFVDRASMVKFISSMHRYRNELEPMNKLTLHWVRLKRVYMLDGKPLPKQKGNIRG